MASTDAKHIPVKNSAYRVTFPIFDADGDLVTGATGLDSEVSIDGGTFADCTNEATEIATSSGMYYLDLTAAEMNGDTIALIIKTSSSGAKTTPIVLYTAARSVNDLAYPTVSGRSLDVSAGGEAGVDWANVGSPTTTLNLSGTTVKTATDVETDTADIQGRLPAALGANGNLKADVRDWKGVALIDGPVPVSGVPTVNVNYIDGDTSSFLGSALNGLAGMASDYVADNALSANVVSMEADTLTASALAGSAVTEIQNGLSTLNAAGVRTAVGLASANLDTQLAALVAILADTTELADTVLADSVPADGALGTLKQTLYEIRQFLFEVAVSGTTVTSKKADGNTTLETFTTNSATAPTSITRSG